MKQTIIYFGAALLAAAVAGLIAYLTGHVPHDGLHENLDPHPSGIGTLFFYWWGGIMAALSPLIYLWMWRKAREYGQEGQEPF
jgi:hypothetical protein